jgi:hypothetical protein
MIPNDDRPGPPGGGEMFLCPVNGCPWRYARAKPGEAPWVWAHSLDASVLATMIARDQNDEAILRAHLAEHSPEEFARTIMELRAELVAAGCAHGSAD